jgi:hypothetical protein
VKGHHVDRKREYPPTKADLGPKNKIVEFAELVYERPDSLV